jgi:hypothetical protein
MSYTVLEQNDTTLHLKYESSYGNCRSWHIHPLILILGYLSDGRCLDHLNEVSQLNVVLFHISNKAYALQSLVSPIQQQLSSKYLILLLLIEYVSDSLQNQCVHVCNLMHILLQQHPLKSLSATFYHFEYNKQNSSNFGIVKTDLP